MTVAVPPGSTHWREACAREGEEKRRSKGERRREAKKGMGDILDLKLEEKRREDSWGEKGLGEGEVGLGKGEGVSL